MCARRTITKGIEVSQFLRNLNSGIEPLTTVCPKVAEKSNVPCFSTICAWILKPFDLQIAMKVRFVMMYDNP